MPVKVRKKKECGGWTPLGIFQIRNKGLTDVSTIYKIDKQQRFTV